MKPSSLSCRGAKRRLLIRPTLLAAVVLAAPLVAQTDWTRLATPGPVPARSFHAMAHDLARGRTVLFGGEGSMPRVFADTWEWDGKRWTRATPRHAPLARGRAAIAYDRARRQVVLFGGGVHAVVQYGDMWTWDGTDWRRWNLEFVPGARIGAVMAYDAARAEIVLFGGFSNAKGFLDDTWIFDGRSWRQARPTRHPGARADAAMAYDERRREIVLFGGYSQTGNHLIQHGDTWIWDGRTWVQRHPTAAPSKRSTHAMTYDFARERVVLFGNAAYGSAIPPDTWEWDGRTWIQRRPARSPHSMSGPRLVYDPVRGHVLASLPSDAPPELQQTWIYRTQHPAESRAFGTGCRGSVGLPGLGISTRPWLGDTLRFTAARLPNATTAVLVVGLSNRSWRGRALPIPLAFLGMPGCSLLVGPDLALAARAVRGEARWTLPLPGDPTLAGRNLYQQAAIRDAAANAWGWSWSNGLALRLGLR